MTNSKYHLRRWIMLSSDSANVTLFLWFIGLTYDDTRRLTLIRGMRLKIRQKGKHVPLSAIHHHIIIRAKWFWTPVQLLIHNHAVAWRHDFRDKRLMFHWRQFQMHLCNGNLCILIKISLKLVPKRSIDNESALFKIMAWSQPGDCPLTVTRKIHSTYAYMCRQLSTS